jgi:hypothetical protein
MKMATETKTDTRTLAQRINAVQQQVDYIQKERKDGMKYTIVSHDAVTAKVRPLFVKEGVLYYPRDMSVSVDGNRTQAVFSVRFVSIDDAQDFIDVATFGFGVDTSDKGPGKAMSYGVKYALLKCLGLETGDDADNDDIGHRSKLDDTAAALVNLIDVQNSIEGLQALMADESTIATMSKLANDNPAKHSLVRGFMAKKNKELKAS